MTIIINIRKTWDRIFSAAEIIREMKPWEWMSETDIFGIKIPETERIYFISVMGSACEVTAISAYMGTRALGMFWELQQTEPGYLTSSFMTGSMVLTIPQLMLDFVEEKILGPEKITRFKNLGAKPSVDKRWPVLDQFVPGFVPEEPEQLALGDAAIIFEQCPEIFRYTKEDDKFIYPGDDNEDLYLIREMKTGSETEWQNVFKEILIEPVKYNIRFSSAGLARLSGYPKKPELLQIDLTMLPSQVNDGKTKPYFPFMLLVVNKKSGFVRDFEMLPPLPDIDSMYESVPQKILEILLKNNYRPYQIELRSEILITLLSQLFAKAGIILKKTKHMKAMDEAMEGVMEHLRNG